MTNASLYVLRSLSALASFLEDAGPGIAERVTAWLRCALEPGEIMPDVALLFKLVERRLRRAHERHLPVVGICLGHQLVAAALGGEVGPMDTPEWGFHRIDITPVGQVSTVLAGIQWDHHQLCSGGGGDRRARILQPRHDLSGAELGLQVAGADHRIEANLVGRFDHCRQH